MALTLVDQGRLDEAAAHYRWALSIKPESADTHNNFAALLARQGKIEEAVAHFRRALAIQPDKIGVHDNLGKILADRGEVDEALAHFREALELQPDDPEAHYQMAVALDRRGQGGEAAIHYRQAVALRPKHSDSRNDLAWLLATCPTAAVRNGAEAVTQAQQARQLAGDVPSILDTLAAAQAEAGRFPEALATAHRALELAVRQNDKALAEAVRGRIALYAAGRPFRQSPPAAAPAR